MTEMEVTWRVITGVVVGREWKEGIGNKKHKWWVQNRHGEVKNSIVPGETRQYICMIHGHELREDGMMEGGGCRV